VGDRKSIRLRGYDYSSDGRYFITVDSWHKRKIFGMIVGGKMVLNQYGKILEEEILNTHIIRHGVNIPVFQIMPDHFHMILEISVGAHGNAPVQSGCGEISVGAHGNAPVQSGCGEISVGAHGNAPVQSGYGEISVLQSGCGEISVGAHGNAPVQNLPVQNLGYIIRGIKMAVSTKLKIIGYQLQVWQRNYYEMIVRDESDYNRVVKYILNNPLKL